MHKSVDVHGVTFDLTGEPIAACRGIRENGVPMEPDYPAYFEIATIKIGTVEVSDILCESTLEAIQEAADAEVRS